MTNVSNVFASMLQKTSSRSFHEFIEMTMQGKYQNISEKNRMRYFLKNLFWTKSFSVTTDRRSRCLRLFFYESFSESFINPPAEHS